MSKSTLARCVAPAESPGPSERPARLPDEVVDTAIAWSIRFDRGEPGATAQRAFAQWLRAHPAHQEAWTRVAALRDGFSELPSRLALETLQAADVRRKAERRHRRQALKLLSASGLTLAAGWLAREHTPWQRLVAEASTAVGEQKLLTLADGTELTLNTDSAISTELSGDRRLVVLHRGEIRIATGADAHAATRRPFWVHTPFGRMQALGTRFVVRLERDHARIGVQEGAVALHPARASGTDASAVVQPGEAFSLTETGSARWTDRGLEVDAWTDGVIAGHDMRLADLVAELSRYRSGRIVCDERVAELRVSGVFHIRDTDQALRFLAQTQPVSVGYRTRWWVTVGPQTPS